MSKPRPRRRDLNRFLGSLPSADYRRILSALEPVTLGRGDVIHNPERPGNCVYFPRSAVASIVSRMDEGGTIEVATIGNEGFVGLFAYLGNGDFPFEIFVQIPGEAGRLDVRVFRHELSAGGAFGELIRRYTQALLVQIAQTAACNRVHPIDKRCARWLLMSHDRVPGDQIRLTQEFLAEMLGVRRAGVTVAAGMLRRRRLIDYHRGNIEVLDRKGLEGAACECYGFIRAEHERQVG